MAKRPISKKERRQKENRQIFVGRKAQLDMFRDNLTNSIDKLPEKDIINIYGNSGMGKTTIAKQYQKLAKQQKYLTAFIDLENTKFYEVTAIMDRIATEIEKLEGTKSFKEFNKRYETYRQKRGELEADPERPTELIGRLVGSTVKKTAKAGLNIIVPSSGEIINHLPMETAGEVIEESINYLFKKFKKDEVELLREPLKVLTPLWIEGLYENATLFNICLFFDTYEISTLKLRDWLYRLYNEEYGELPANLIICISGQKSLDSSRWNEYKAYIGDVQLESFKNIEAEEYLTRRGIANKAIIEQIISIAGGLPVYLTLLSENNPTSTFEVIDQNETVVERFLRHITDPFLRQLVERAALPRKLNQDVIKCLLPEELPNNHTSSSLFEWLTKLAFVEKRGGFWVYHPIPRKLIAQYFRERSLEEWKKNHLRIATMYEKIPSRCSLKNLIKLLLDNDWRIKRLEYNYHLFCADKNTGLKEILNDYIFMLAALPPEQIFPLTNTLIEAEEMSGYDSKWGNQMLYALGQRLSGNEAEILPFLKEIRGTIQSELSWYSAVLNSLIGDLLIKVEEYDEAEQCYLEAIKISPKFLSPQHGLGTLYYKKGLLKKALETYQKVILSNPKFFSAWYNIGMIYFLEGEYSDAEKNLKEVIKIVPTHAEAALYLADTQRMLGNYENAINNYKKIVGILSLSSKATIYFRIATCYMSLEEIEAAIDFYKEALEIDENDIQILVNLGNAYRLLLKYKEAEKKYQKALTLDDTDLFALTSMGEHYYELKEFELAMKYFKKAHEIQPDYEYAIGGIGDIYYYQENYAKAAEYYLKINDENNEVAEYWFRLGLMFESYLGNISEAIKYYDKALEKDSSITGAWNNRGTIYSERGEIEKAIEYFKKAVEVDKTLELGWLNLAEQYKILGDKKNRILVLKQLLEVLPNQPFALNEIGYYYYYNGKINEAYQCFKKASEVGGEWSIQAIINLAFIDIANNQLSGLKETLFQAWKNSEHKNPYAPKNIAHLALIAGDEEEAIKWYKIALDTNADIVKDFESDYDNLKLQQKGITRKKYDQVLELER